MIHQIGLVCALSLLVIASGYRLEWDQAACPPRPCWLRNHPSALEHATFVAEKVAEGVVAGTMVAWSLACAQSSTVFCLASPRQWRVTHSDRLTPAVMWLAALCAALAADSVQQC